MRWIRSRKPKSGLIEVRAKQRMGLYDTHSPKDDEKPSFWVEQGETFYTDTDGLEHLADHKLIEVVE